MCKRVLAHLAVTNDDSQEIEQPHACGCQKWFIDMLNWIVQNYAVDLLRELIPRSSVE